MRIGRPLSSRPSGPGLLGVGCAKQELAGLSVQHVEEGVAVRKEHQLPLFAVERCVGQNRNLGRVPVVDVVRCELEVPLHLPGVGVERHHRVGVEVVAHAHGAVVVGSWVSSAPVDQIQLGVVGAGHPGGRPAPAPRIARPCPAVGVVGAGGRVETPLALARVDVVGVHEPAYPVLATRNAAEDLVADNQRRRRLAVAGLGLLSLGLPHHTAGLGVERHHMCVERNHDDAVTPDGHTPVVSPAAEDHVVRELVLVSPVGAAGRRVDRDDGAGRLGDIHHAIDHQRRRSRPGRAR